MDAVCPVIKKACRLLWTFGVYANDPQCLYTKTHMDVAHSVSELAECPWDEEDDLT